MSRSQRLRLSDVRSVFTLVGECCELWADPPAWRDHLINGAIRLTRSMTGMMQEFHLTQAPNAPRISVIGTAGWPDESSYRAYLRMVADQPEMPSFERAIPKLMRERRNAFARQDVSPCDEWYRSVFFRKYMSQADSDHFAVAMRLAGEEKPLIESISVGRHLHDPLYTRRDVRSLDLLHRQIAPLIGTRLATEQQRSMFGLPPRCQPTLEWLLRGASEKEIALLSHRSINTIHEHVKVIYRHFDVASRGELLAYFVQRRPRMLDEDAAW